MMELQIEALIEGMFKMVLALICSGVLGMERGLKKRPAGFRTYMLVCLGATLAMMTNQYICEAYVTGDPSRMGAQVISGIGFLGAGTIITTRHSKVRGLTTAAGLWAVACIGLAIGIGFYEGAIIGTAMIFLAMVSMHRLDTFITASANEAMMYIELDKISSMKNLTAFLKEKEIKILEMETESIEQQDGKGIAVIASLKLPTKNVHQMLPYMLGKVEGVTYVEEI